MQTFLHSSLEPKTLPIRTLVPHKAPRAPKPVGPGRIERGYQQQIAQLNGAVENLQSGHVTLERRLETARLVERGTDRYVNRVESQLNRERSESKRLLVVLGSLHKENQMMLAEMARLESAMAARIPAARTQESPGWRQKLAGLLGLGASQVRSRSA